MSAQSSEPRRDEIRYDTEEGALRSRSVHLVRRGRGRDTHWSLSLEPAGDRYEFVLPGLTSRPSNLPAGLRRPLTPITGGKPLLRQPEPHSPYNDDGGRGDKAGAPNAAAALTTALGKLSDQLVLWDLAVRLNLPDAAHQMRVTCRSLRGVLKAASPFLDRDPANGLALRLRDLARVLGAARDAEITAELLPARLGALAKPLHRQAATMLQHKVDSEAATAAASARRHLEGKGHLQLLADVQAFTRQPPLTDRVQDKSARRLANRLVRRSLRKAARVAADSSAVPGELNEHRGGKAVLEHAHEVRKAVKQVRYVLSALRSVGVRPGKQIRRAAADAKRYQQELGAIMDAAVVLAWLTRTAQELQGSADAYSIGLLLGAETLRVNEGAKRCEQLIDELLRDLPTHSGS